MSLPEIRLKVRATGRHPWFYRKMIEKPASKLPAGGPVRVIDRDRRFVGTGFYNPRTELALRMLSRADTPDVDELLARLLTAACALREDVLGLPRVTTAYRLVHAEGDGVPGLVLDRLGDTIVGQLFSLAMQQRIERIGEQLLSRYPKTRLALLVDDTAREREGMDKQPPPAGHDTEIQEHGIRFLVQPGQGHKTGFFADQRDNRQLVRMLSRGRTVLDLCCHAGGFALAAALGGAKRVVAVDLDEAAVAATRANAQRNGARVEARHEDAFATLRNLTPGAHDLLILDPPKWISGKAELETGVGRYRDFNRLAFEKAAPGTVVVTCSCSGALSEDSFLRLLREAAAQAHRDVAVLAVRGAGPDHPVALECPETRYLKVVVAVCR